MIEKGLKALEKKNYIKILKLMNYKNQKLNYKFCLLSDSSTWKKKKKKPSHQVDHQDLKSSMPSKQILGILEFLGLFPNL